MYLARLTTPTGFFFVLRESVKTQSGYASRDIFPLGTSPAHWIHYEGERHFYLDDALLDVVGERAEEAEELLWPWVKPEIRRAVATFRERDTPSPPRLTPAEKADIHARVHPFDKRRALFLKFASMDQGAIDRMPATLFRHLVDKSRDEIEQSFMAQEAILKIRELKTYVYTVLDLQRHFQSFMATRMPHVLDQGKVADFCVEDLCRVNQTLFPGASTLSPFLVRYLIMFFDYDYDDSDLLDEMTWDFINRHRKHRTNAAPPPSVSVDKALDIFGLDQAAFKALDKKGLTRAYRKLARKHHPDQGGKHADFVNLNEGYQALLERLAQRSG
ncbi:MAG: J domain-containing protein [Desulfobacterales bacterium]|nr:J domain-containing protein [Desulfobacterales bacterium]